MSNMQLHVPYRNGHVRNGHLTITRESPGTERRRGNTRIPDDPGSLLSEAQSTALPGIQYAGWEICFLRERPFMDPVVVIHNREDGRFGILDIDGSIRAPGELKVRKQKTPELTTEIEQTQKHTYITV